MLDVSADPRRSARPPAGPPLDFQAHLAALEAQGLLVRVDRPINKDTELHPLVRWQFQGGLAEDQRRAFLFTNVTDSSGRRYDIPVAVGALAASPQIYAVGMGRPVEEIEAAWVHAIAHPIAPIAVSSPPCQAVVIQGDDLRGPGKGLARLPVPISTPGFDAAPYLTATLCVTRDPDTGIQNMGTYRGALKATDRLGVRMASRIGGAGGYLHWKKHNKRREPMPCAIVIGCAPVAMFTGGMKLAIDLDEMAVAGGLAGAPIRMAKSRHRRSQCAGRRRNRHRRADRSRSARAGRAVRRKPRSRRARGFQHVHARDCDHAQAVAGVRVDHQPGDAERIERAQEGGDGALLLHASARTAFDQRRSARGDARAALQPAQGDLRPVRTRHAADRGLARTCTVPRRCSPIAGRSASR